MKKKRLLYTTLSVILGSGLIFCTVLSKNHWKSAAFKNVDIRFQYSDNQAVVVGSEVSPLIDEFLASQPDSSALSVPAFLLETSLEALPYVADAQVYWNLKESLVITIEAKQSEGIYERPAVFIDARTRAHKSAKANAFGFTHHYWR